MSEEDNNSYFDSNLVWESKDVGSYQSEKSSDNNYYAKFNTGVTGKTLFKDLFFYVSYHTGYGGGTEIVVNSSSYDPQTGVLTVKGWYSKAGTITIWYIP